MAIHPTKQRRALGALRIASIAAAMLPLMISDPAHAQEFLLPAQCRQIASYDDALGKQFLAAAARYDAFNGAKGILMATLADSQRDLYWHSGTIDDLRRAAYIIQKVSDATVHGIAGLTPEGAVMGTIEDAAGELAGIVKTWIERVDWAKEKGEKVQEFISGEKPTLGAAIKEIATKDEVVKAVQAAMRKAGFVRLAPIARNIAELVQAESSLMDAIKAGQLADEQRAAEGTGRQAIADLQLNIFAYQAAIQSEATSMTDLQAIHEAIERDLRSSCSTKPCDDAEKSAVAARDQKHKDAQELLGKAAALKQSGPDLKANNDAIGALNEQVAALVQEAAKTLDDLEQKIRDLVDERNAALDELRRGLFCSKCRRTATEIEREEHISFEAHLGNVQGVAVPASPEEIADRAAEYDDKIAELQAALDRASHGFQTRYEGMKTQYAGLVKDRAKIVAQWLADIQKLETNAKKIIAAADALYATEHRRVELCRKA